MIKPYKVKVGDGYKTISGEELTDISGELIATQLPEGVDVLKGIWKSEELTFTAEAIDVEELKKALGISDEIYKRLETDIIIKFVEVLGAYCRTRPCESCPFNSSSHGDCLLMYYGPGQWCSDDFEDELIKNGYRFSDKEIDIKFRDKAVKDEKMEGRA